MALAEPALDLDAATSRSPWPSSLFFAVAALAGLSLTLTTANTFGNATTPTVDLLRVGFLF